MAASQQELRKYQWVETTTVSLKGEQKSFKEQELLYGADGKLQKLPSPRRPRPRRRAGLRGKIMESKTEEMSATMKQAVGLVKTYVPPDSALIDRAVKSGNVAVEMIQPGKVARIDIKNYELPGDVLAITIDATTNHLLGIKVNTYLGDPSKPVTMTSTMGQPAGRDDVHGQDRDLGPGETNRRRRGERGLPAPVIRSTGTRPLR